MATVWSVMLILFRFILITGKRGGLQAWIDTLLRVSISFCLYRKSQTLQQYGNFRLWSGTSKYVGLFWYQYHAFFVVYKLTIDCTIISNTVITNNMLLHVSTFKMSSSGSSLCLAKITYRFSGLSKIKLLKYKMINFNKTLIVQRNIWFA